VVRRVVLVIVMVTMVAGCSLRPKESSTLPTAELPHIAVRSEAFEDGQPIPKRFTCDGENVPPPLSWSGVPSGAARVAVVVDDPDAPGGTFVHWLVLLAPTATSVPEDIGGYRGPCPPPGPPHHYRFSVYALGGSSPLDPPAIRKAAIAAGTLTGTFSR